MTPSPSAAGRWTAGPWRAHEQRHVNGKSLGWIIEHSNGRIGWSAYATTIPNAGEEAPFPISAANARLIAAAPTMAETLVQMRQWVLHWADDHKAGLKPTTGSLSDALEAIDAALAAASQAGDGA